MPGEKDKAIDGMHLWLVLSKWILDSIRARTRAFETYRAEIKLPGKRSLGG